MYIIGKSAIDKQGRVNLSGLVNENDKQIVLVVNVEAEMIQILSSDNFDHPGFGISTIVDSKNRIVLPKWIRDELGDTKELLFIIDESRRYLSPKTGAIIADSK